VNVRFVGTRVGVDGAPEQGDHFDQVERVDAITPGQGRVAITTRPSGINPGEWRVTATPVRYFDARHTATSAAAAKIGPRPPRRDLTAHTRLVPLVHGPGVRLAMWPALVGLGVVVAVVLQAVLLARAHVDATAAVAISLGASIVGYLSAKTWYLVQHRKPLRTFIHAGACIQGFLVGAIATMALALAVSGIPVGTFLDATTPGLFFGMAIGRPGCFLTGCCVGRPTTSRWGLWSSDRRVGIRRIPIQLVEAAVALLIGLVTLALALAADPPFAGAVFLGAIAAYTLCRQVLFPFRAEPRATSLGRTLALGASALVLLVDVAVAALA
jgi:phosphatidylglycerol:prolipoprotein diacylglycerol transferase